MARVVFVEDSALIRYKIREELEQDGHILHAMNSAEQLVVLMSELANQVDLFIIDLHLPGIDGISAIRRLKADPLLRDIPVMVLSADKNESSVRGAVEAGAMDYLIKPFAGEVLRQRVRRLLKLSSTYGQELERVLKMEISRAQRASTPLAVVMLQIHSKDRSMLVVPDESLLRIINQRFRDIDSIHVRDQRLVLVLPYTDRSGAQIVAGKAIEWLAEVEPNWETTVGSALYPEDGQSVEELLHWAN